MHHQKKRKKNPRTYFDNPKSSYDFFVNKKWRENSERYSSRDTFITAINGCWKNLKGNKEELDTYMEKDIAPYKKKSIMKSFFKLSTTKSADATTSSILPDVSTSPNIVIIPPSTPKGSPITTSNVSASPNIVIIPPSTPKGSPITTSKAGPDAAVAFRNRELYLTNSEDKLIASFLNDIKFSETENFLTQDVKSDTIFMKFMKSLAYSWNEFFSLEKPYLSSRTTCVRNSAIKKKRETIQSTVSELVVMIHETSSIKINENMSTSLISASYMKKSELLKGIMEIGGRLNVLITDSNLKYTLRKRIAEEDKTRNKGFTRDPVELPSVVCLNSTHRLWEDVIDDIILSCNSNEKSSPLPWDQLHEIADVISSNVVIPMSDLNMTDDFHACIYQIVRLMPVMHVSSPQGGVFINLHEFVYVPGALEYLLSPPAANNINNIVSIEEEDTGCERLILCSEETAATEEENESSKRKGGQPPLIQLFPDIVKTVFEFLKQHGYAAHHRRRDETIYSSGVTIAQIKEHLFMQIPGLREHGISNSTVRRLFNPPHKGRTSGKRYKGHVDARVGVKCNSYREHHIDAHYLFARNKQRREFASLFKDDVNIISLDDMSKVKVGPAAVSRYHQIRSIYLTNNMPNLSDHDFPVKGYYLNVSGYMMLDNLKSTEDEDALVAGSFENQSQYDSVERQEEVIGNCPAYLRNNNLEIGTTWQSLYDTLVNQLLQHLNIKTDINELKEILLNDVKNDELVQMLKQDTDSLTQSNIVDIVLQFSKVFQSKVIFFDLEKDVVQELIAKNALSSNPPIFVAVNEDGLTASPTFQKEISRKLVEDYPVENLHHDSIGRLHLKTPHSGHSYIAIRAQRFNSTTIATHVTDLYNFLQSNPDYISKAGLMLMSDGGPDFNPMSLLNEIFLFRLFKTLQLDFMSIFTYAARYSAFNCVEHLWAPMSNKLASVVFSPLYPGDKTPPAQQSKLLQEERARKEKYIFDRAMGKLKEVHWKELSFDDCPADISVIKCGDDELLYQDYETVKLFLKSPLRDLHKFSDLRSEFVDMFKHIDRHRNEVVFMKCIDKSCCSEFRSLDLKSFFQRTQNMFPAPTLSSSRGGHYKTFMEEYENVNKKFQDEGQPSVTETLGSCLHCPKLNFFSETEKKRHNSVYHRRKSTNPSVNKVNNPNKRHKCNFRNCSKLFGSSSALSRHQIKEKHRARDQLDTKIAKKRKNISNKKRRPMNIAEFKRIANHRFSSSEDDSIDEVDEEVEDEGIEGEEVGSESLDESEHVDTPMDLVIDQDQGSSYQSNGGEEESSDKELSPEEKSGEVEISPINPQVGEHWVIRLGSNTYLVVVTEVSEVISVRYYFSKTPGRHLLGETQYEAALGDFVRKISDPQIVPVGRDRLYYIFQNDGLYV